MMLQQSIQFQNTQYQHQAPVVQSRNNLPQVYQSKMTNNSSQNNLVLYDSTNTDVFKSKMLKKPTHTFSTQYLQNNLTQQNTQPMRKLDFQSEENLNEFEDNQEDFNLHQNPDQDYSAQNRY